MTYKFSSYFLPLNTLQKAGVPNTKITPEGMGRGRHGRWEGRHSFLVPVNPTWPSARGEYKILINLISHLLINLYPQAKLF